VRRRTAASNRASGVEAEAEDLGEAAHMAGILRGGGGNVAEIIAERAEKGFGPLRPLL
jgi:hypothetical protein